MCPKFLLPFWKQWENLDVMLASIQETLIKKVNNILIQAATSF
jgi:hypothetical protein